MHEISLENFLLKFHQSRKHIFSFEEGIRSGFLFEEREKRREMEEKVSCASEEDFKV
jgi:hypothetical protein